MFSIFRSTAGKPPATALDLAVDPKVELGWLLAGGSSNLKSVGKLIRDMLGQHGGAQSLNDVFDELRGSEL